MLVATFVQTAVQRGTERLAPLRIREVMGSNQGLETGYHDGELPWFSSVHLRKCLDSALN